MNRQTWAVLVLAALAGSCASGPTAAKRPSAATAPNLQLDAQQARANLPLDDILPRPVLAAPATTRPAGSPAPVEALVLYSRAVDALNKGRPFDAIDALQQAIAIDQDSYELYCAMGEAELARWRGAAEPSFAAFERAAAIRPDDLRIHLLLARQYMIAGDPQRALVHLRLAQLTHAYKHSWPGSATAQVLLASVLERLGYDRAALDEYLAARTRLSNPAFDPSREPDVGFMGYGLAFVKLQIGRLYEKHARYADALVEYRDLAGMEPASFPLQANVVRMLQRLGEQREASVRAAHIVQKFGDAASLALLNDLTAQFGAQSQEAMLRRLWDADGDDQDLLFALVDVLAADGHMDQARQTLDEAAVIHDGQADFSRRSFDFFVSHDDTARAAAVLVQWLAAEPDSVLEIDDRFQDITRFLRKNSLRLSTFQKLDVPESARAAKLYLTARLAEQWQRDALTRQSLDEAVKIIPPFAPAYRAQFERFWEQRDLTEAQRTAAISALARRAADGGAAALAAELRGRAMVAQENFHDALGELQEAIRLGGSSPDLALTYAVVLKELGRMRECEQTLYKLVAQRPQYDEAWNILYLFVGAQQEDEAQRISRLWRAANPGSAKAMLHQVALDERRGQSRIADDELGHLMENHADDPETLTQVQFMYRQQNREAEFFARLQSLHHRQPQNLVVVEPLIAIYMRANRPEDAAAILDETRAAVGSDPDMIYQLSNLYEQVGQDEKRQELLEDVLKLDPGHAPASNDLGFIWADQGKNLAKAEDLIRAAVAAEPDNQAYLDSLGWVLYKRGKFAEAQTFFEEAIAPAETPDPEILDHFGDDLYRLGKKTEAARQWQLSRLVLQNRRDSDADKLANQVDDKLRATESGKAPAVAPLGAEN